MKLARTFICGLWVVSACGGPDLFDPSKADHTGMEVEPIPWELLGTTKLFFTRVEPGAYGTISLDGGSKTTAISYPARGPSLAVQPITRTLAFISYQPVEGSQRFSDIWLQGWTSSAGQPLGGQGGSRFDPSWSADGARLIYAESAELSPLATRIVSQSLIPGAPDKQVLWSGTGACELVANPKENVARDLVFIFLHGLGPPADCDFSLSIARLTPGAQPQILYTASEGAPLVVAWSASGGEIAFGEEPFSGPRGTIVIKAMTADGSNLRTVATVTTGTGGLNDGIFSLCWARDGSRLFFDLPGAAKGAANIYTVALSGGPITRITTATEGNDRYLSCS